MNNTKNHKSSIINHESQTLKRFVNDFNFPSPSWENLPNGFPDCDTKDLTVQEIHLLEAIKTIWFLSQNKNYYVLKAIYKSSTFISFVILFLEIISTIYYLNIKYQLGLNFLTELFA